MMELSAEQIKERDKLVKKEERRLLKILKIFLKIKEK